MLRLLAQREEGYDDMAALMGISVEEVRERVKEALAEVGEPPTPVETPEPPPVPVPPPAPKPSAPMVPPSPPAAEAPPAPPAPAKPAAEPVARKMRSTQTPSLKGTKDGAALTGLGAGFLVVLALVIVLIAGGDGGGSSSSGTTSGE